MRQGNDRKNKSHEKKQTTLQLENRLNTWIDISLKEIHSWKMNLGCSIPATVREMPIKTTMNYNHTPIRMGKIKKKNHDNTKSWWGCWATGSFRHCWWEYKMVQPLGTTVWQPPYQLATTVQPGNHTNSLDVYPEKRKLMFIQKSVHKFSRLLYWQVENWSQPRCFLMVKQLNKQVCPYHGLFTTQPWKGIYCWFSLVEYPENCAQWKELVPKGYRLYDFISVTFLKVLSYRDGGEISGCQWLGMVAGRWWGWF